MPYKVSISECETYNQVAVRSGIEKVISELGGIRKFIHKGQRVLLKINLLSDKTPEKAVTTHPAIVEAVIDIVKKAGAEPVVGDSPFPMLKFDTVTEKTGIAEVCKRKKVTLLDLSGPTEFENPDGLLIKKFKLTKYFNEFDAIIDIPKLKTHTFMVFTGAVKNLFGLVPGQGKPKFHLQLQRQEYFSKMLLDLYTLTKPKVKLVIMDGIVGMDGPGPSSGKRKKIGYIIGGTDALAVDTMITEILRIRTKVPYLAIADKIGMASADINNIQLKGGNIEDFYVNDFRLPRSVSLLPFFSKLGINLLGTPHLHKLKCIGCERCYKACPNHAITMSTGKPVFNYSKCIKCYCCQEICPQNAIYLKDNLISRTVDLLKKRMFGGNK